MKNNANKKYAKHKNKKVIGTIGHKGKGDRVKKSKCLSAYMFGGSCGMSLLGEDYDVCL